MQYLPSDWSDQETEDSLGPDGTLIMYFILSFFALLINITFNLIVKIIYIISAVREKKIMDAECDRKNLEYRALKKSMEPVQNKVRERYVAISDKWVKVGL